MMDQISRGRGPSALDWKVRGGAVEEEGAPPDWSIRRTALPIGATTRDWDMGKNKAAEKVGLQDWSIRGNAEQSPGLQHPGLKKEEDPTAKNTSLTEDTRSRPAGMEEHRGRFQREEPATRRPS